MCEKCSKVLLLEFVFMIILLMCSCSVREKTDAVYELCKSSFNCINDVMLNCEDGGYMFDTEDSTGKGNIMGIYRYVDSKRFYLDVAQEEIDALNDMKDNLKYDFSTICVTDDFIYYGGIGLQAYAYSVTGEKPRRYMDMPDVDFKTYQIDDNWYLLQL